MKRSYPQHNPIVLFLALFLLSVTPLQGQGDIFTLKNLLRLAKIEPEEAHPSDRIYFDGTIVYCTGESRVALENNRAADLMKEGDYEGAVSVLREALRHAALFFPFRYNLGTCYFHLGDLDRSLLNYNKARAVVPEYAGTYLRIGMIHQRWYRDTEAIEYYRMALRKNRNELTTYILIGDLFYQRDQIQVAKKYYNAALSIDPRYPNGLLGKAKIHFKEEEYHKALVLLKSINTEKEYDISYHYYYAECSFKLQNYSSARTHYSILLQHPNDKFFLTNAASLIRHKLDLSNRFIRE